MEQVVFYQTSLIKKIDDMARLNPTTYKLIQRTKKKGR